MQQREDNIMKKVISSLALATALAAGAAQAADLPSRNEAPVYVPPPPVMTWTGFYVGLNIGGEWENHSHGGWGWNGFDWVWGGPNFGNFTEGGVMGGGQIGYNYQITPMFVVGMETDFQGASSGGNREVDWFGTVRGRTGVTLLPQLLVYGTGGFAYGDVRLNTGAFFNGTLQQTTPGWTAGGGVEWAFMPDWSTKVEYLYVNIGGNNFGGGPFLPEQRVHAQTIRLGLNYHFDLFGTAPIVAKY